MVLIDTTHGCINNKIVRRGQNGNHKDNIMYILSIYRMPHVCNINNSDGAKLLKLMMPSNQIDGAKYKDTKW